MPALAAPETPTPAERALSAHDCRAVAEAVRTAVGRESGARRCWERIARDALAVLCGLRPAAMLDYAVLSEAAAAKLLRSIRDSLPALCPCGPLHALVVDGCVFPCNLRRLSESLDQSPAGDQLILLDGGRPRWATPEEARRVSEGLEPIRGAVRRATAWDEGGRGGETPPGVVLRDSAVLLRLEEAVGRSFTELGGGCGVPMLPTVNGWLLGYPAIYVVSAEAAEEACRAFRLCSTHHFTVHLPCLALPVPEPPPRGGRARLPAAAPDVLFSFTAPSALCERGADEPWARRCLPPLSGAGGGSRRPGGAPPIWGRAELRAGPSPAGVAALF